MLRYIRYKGENLPLSFGFTTLLNFQRETGKGLADIEKDLMLLEPLMYWSLKRGAEKEGNYRRIFGFRLYKINRFKYSRSEVNNILDATVDEFIEQFKEATKVKNIKKK